MLEHRKTGGTTSESLGKPPSVASAHPWSASGNLDDAKASPAVPFLPRN